MNPSLLKARQRMQSAIERDYGATVTVGGKTYAAAIAVRAVMPEMRSDGGGSVLVQRAGVSIRKTLLPTAPARGSVVTTSDGITWHIESVAGQNAIDTAWLFELTRLPA